MQTEEQNPVTQIQDIQKITRPVIKADDVGVKLLDKEKLKEEIKLPSAQPLSYIQKDLWTISQIAPNNYAYNTLFSVNITSKVNIIALEKFFQIFIDRHEILRTNFYPKDGIPYQIINDCSVDFRRIDASSWDIATLKQEAFKAYSQPFNLEKDRLFRVFCFIRSEKSTVIVLSTHHIVCDAWSMSLLLNELKLIYPALVNLAPIPFPTLKTQYKDFVTWQQNFVKSNEAEFQFKYWEKLLGNDVPLLNLPYKNQTPSKTKLEGKTYFFKIDKQLTQKIKDFAKHEKITLHTFFLSIYHLLFHKYTDLDKVVTGSPTFSRLRTTFGLSRADFKNNVGTFINLILNKSDISDNPSFQAFVQKMQAICSNIYKNQDYPLSLLLEKLKLKHKDRSVPQAIFVYQKKRRGDKDLAMFLFETENQKGFNLGGLQLESFYMPQQEGQFEIVWELLESEEEVYCNLKYQTDMFDLNTVKRLAEHLKQLILNAVNSPTSKVEELELITPEEKHQILHDFNNTKADYPKNKTIHQLFEEQVDKTPNNIAVVCGDQQLTYQELNTKANQLARHLQKLGVKPDTIVGIMVERSLEMIIGIMGILKAGGAYLPIDPVLPEERINYIFNDANVSLILTQNYLKEKIKKVNYLSLNENIYTGLNSNLSQKATQDNIAYVIYTSGSTGLPKGVVINHQSLGNLCYWHNESFKVTPFDKSTQIANIGFDASVWEIFPYLIKGASLHVIRKEFIHNVDKLNKYFEERQISISFLPTPLCEEFIKLKNKTLRVLLTGGDKLKQYEKQDYLLVNNYGPTENTVVTTSFAVTNKNYSNIPIGKPISNVEVYILSQKGHIQPIGISGELCISGAGLARGYLNKQEISRKKFIDNPFEQGGKIYRTGDLARWLPDGNIEFLGRSDYQVKIRGFRIELGEIEANILKNSMIKETIVIAKETQPNLSHLIAYIVPKEKHDIDIAKLRNFLQTKLPDYMVPTFFVELDKIPLNSSGKYDRKALPEPDFEDIFDKKACLKPRTSIEKRLVEIWEKLLNIPNISINADFFELGGNSLLVISLISKLQDKFNKKITVQTIYNYSTIESFAEFLTNNKIELTDFKIIKKTKRSSQLNNFYTLLNESSIEIQTNKNNSKIAAKQVVLNSQFFQRAYEDSSNVAFVGNLMCAELLLAMDILPFNVEMVSGFLAYANKSSKFINISEQHNYSNDICSASRCILGAALADCFPTPDFIAFSSYPCDTAAKMFYALSDQYKKDFYMLDIPYQNNETSIIYLINQIKEMIQILEQKFNKKFNLDKLEKIINNANISFETFLKMNNLVKTKSPLPLGQIMDYTLGYSLFGTKEMVEISKAYYQAVNNHISLPIDKEKIRIMWRGLKPFYNNEIIEYLENKHNIELISEYQLYNTDNFDMVSFLDLKDPIKNLAKRLYMLNKISKPLEYIVQTNKTEIIKELGIQGVISFNQWGCRANLSTTHLIKSALNMPFIEIDGDYIDSSNYSFSQIKLRLDAFVEILGNKEY
jgi:bacitracin synthase 3